MKTRFIRLEITQDDIDAADDESDNCPVVATYKRAGFDVEISQHSIVFKDNEPHVSLPMALQLSFFLQRFERGRFVEPCSFTVEVPDG